MSRGPCTFKQRDLTAAVKAAQAAGLFVARIEVDRDGKIVVITGKPTEPVAGQNGKGEWEGATL